MSLSWGGGWPLALTAGRPIFWSSSTRSFATSAPSLRPRLRSSAVWSTGGADTAVRESRGRAAWVAGAASGRQDGLRGGEVVQEDTGGLGEPGPFVVLPITHGGLRAPAHQHEGEGRRDRLRVKCSWRHPAP